MVVGQRVVCTVASNDVSDENMRQLYKEGFWYWRTGGKRLYNRQHVREIRGIRPSRREIAEAELKCAGMVTDIDTCIWKALAFGN